MSVYVLLVTFCANILLSTYNLLISSYYVINADTYPRVTTSYVLTALLTLTNLWLLKLTSPSVWIKFNFNND